MFSLVWSESHLKKQYIFLLHAYPNFSPEMLLNKKLLTLSSVMSQNGQTQLKILLNPASSQGQKNKSE